MRFVTRRGPGIAVVFATASILALAPLAAAQGDRPSETELGWLESFLMTDDERRVMIRAFSAGDRAAFRRLFWMRRDPDPRTPENETLDHYLGRVRLADRTFSADGGYGGGDRARVFVLLGMPVSAIPQPPTETTPEGLLWVYSADPESGLSDDLRAQYRRDETGSLWLENRVAVDAALEAMRRRLIARPEMTYQTDEAGLLRIPNLPAGGSERARQLLRRLVNSPETTGMPFRVTPAFFRVEDGATYVALLFETEPGRLAVGSDGQNAASVFAHAVAGPDALPDEAAPVRGVFRRESAHTGLVGGGGPGGLETSLVLPPGRHRLLLGLVDEQSEAFGTADIQIEAPAFPAAEPAFSSVVLYDDTATTLEYAAGTPGRAFQFGRTHFHPRGDAVFRQDETLGAFYYFYAGEREDDGDLPEIVAEYTLRRDGQDTGFVRPERLPTTTRQAAANAEIELRDFPPGRYELGIRIRYREEIFETFRRFTLVR